jgi:reverse transcriptase-like protein/LTR polyprotein gag-polypeptide-like protein/gag-pre-integrase-like protein/Pol polyprotein
MSNHDFLEGTLTLPQNFQVLTGQDNYPRWLRDFKMVAVGKGVWSLYSGDSKSISKPTKEDYGIEERGTVRKEEPAVKTRMSADKEIAEQSSSAEMKEQGESLADRISRYRLDFDEWRYYDKLQRTALATLMASVHQSIRGNLSQYDTPEDAWRWLKKHFKMSNVRLIEIAYAKLRKIKLTDFNSMQGYINELVLLKDDLKSCGAACDEDFIITTTILGLSSAYEAFVDQYHYQLSYDNKTLSFSELTERLLTQESTIKERTKTTVATASTATDAGQKPKAKIDKSIKKCTFEGCKAPWSHTIEKCFFKDPSQAPKDWGKKKKESTAAAVDTTKKDDIIITTLVASVITPNVKTISTSLSEQDKETWRKLVFSTALGWTICCAPGYGTMFLPPSHKPHHKPFFRKGKQPSFLFQTLKKYDRKLETDNLDEMRPYGIVDGFKECVGGDTADDEVSIIQLSDEPSCGHPMTIVAAVFQVPEIDESEPATPDPKMESTDSPSTAIRNQTERRTNLYNPRVLDTQQFSYDYFLSYQNLGALKHWRRVTKQKIEREFWGDCDCDKLEAWKQIVREIDTELLKRQNTTMMALVEAEKPEKTHDGHVRTIFDSGATGHVQKTEHWMTVMNRDHSQAEAAGSNSFKITARGNSMIPIREENQICEFTMTDTCVAPDIQFNILSMSKLDEAGFSGTWGNGKITCSDSKGRKVFTAKLKNRLYDVPVVENYETLRQKVKKDTQKKLDSSATTNKTPVVAAINLTDKIWHWHRRLGHLGLSELSKLVDISIGMSISASDIKKRIGAICEICAMTSPLIHISTEPYTQKYTKPGALIAMDIWGPHNRVTGHDGTKYFLVLTDVYSGYSWCARLPRTGGDLLFRVIKILHKRIERVHEFVIRRYRMDNAFMTHEISDWAQIKGIRLEPSAAYHHNQNGTAERGFRTIRSRTSAMMGETTMTLSKLEDLTNFLRQDIELEGNIWPEAFQHAVWLKNRSPTARKHGKTPWEIIMGEKPNLSHDKVWGSQAFKVIPTETRTGISKLLEPRSKVGYFVGMENEYTYRIYDPDNKQQRISRTSWAYVDDRPPFEESVHEDEESSDIPGTEDMESSGALVSSESGTPTAVLMVDTKNSTISEMDKDFVEWLPWELPTADRFTCPMDNCQNPHLFDRDGFLRHLNQQHFTDSKETLRLRCDPDLQEDITSYLTEFFSSKELGRGRISKAKRGTQPKHLKCLSCANRGKVCNRNLPDKDSNIPCSVCERSRMICRPGIEPEPEAKYVFQGDCYMCIMRNNDNCDSTGDEPCTNCIKQGNTCRDIIESDVATILAKHGQIKQKGRGTRTVVRCSNCRTRQKLGINCECDIERPCKPCIEAGTADTCYLKSNNNKCQHCVTMRHNCDGAKPCITCVTKGNVCRYIIEEGGKRMVGRHSGMKFETYRTFQPPFNYDDNEDICRNCKRFRRENRGVKEECKGDPCAQCLKNFNIQLERESSNITKYIWCTRDLSEDKAISTRNPDADTKVPYKRDFASLHNIEDEDDEDTHGDPNEDPEAREERLKLEARERLINHVLRDEFDDRPRKRVKERITIMMTDTQETPSQPKGFHAIYVEEETEGSDSETSTVLFDDEKLNESDGFDSDADEEEDQNEEENSTEPNELETIIAMCASPGIFIPSTYEEAVTCGDAAKWKAAMDDEITSILQNKTWKPVKQKPPKTLRPLRGKWVYRVKLNSDGSIARYKARFVVKGFTQREGIDYHETFSSVVRTQTYLFLFALAAALGLQIHLMDVKTAFLQGYIEEELYLFPPKGYEHLCLPGSILQLIRSLYGLKQSPRMWYKRLREYLVSNGWKESNHDHSLFFKDGTFIAVYVDDLLILSKDLSKIDEVKQLMKNEFQMTDLGPCKTYLGMNIDETSKFIKVHQKSFIQQCVVKYNLDKKGLGKPGLPHVQGQKLVKSTETTNQGVKAEYQSLIGSLIFLATKTRFDIAHQVGMLSRFMDSPTEEHLKAALHTWAYVVRTDDFGLTYVKGANPVIKAYSDSDWGGCLDTSRSTAGWVLTMSGSPISWSSKRQSVVALSSTEAEYMATSETGKEVVWFQYLSEEIYEPIRIKLYMDNAGAIKLGRNPEFHSRTKHIRIRYHWLREKVNEGELDIDFCPGSENKADLFTKPLGKLIFCQMIKRLTSVDT